MSDLAGYREVSTVASQLWKLVAELELTFRVALSNEHRAKQLDDQYRLVRLYKKVLDQLSSS